METERGGRQTETLKFARHGDGSMVRQAGPRQERHHRWEQCCNHRMPRVMQGSQAVCARAVRVHRKR